MFAKEIPRLTGTVSTTTLPSSSGQLTARPASPISHSTSRENTAPSATAVTASDAAPRAGGRSRKPENSQNRKLATSVTARTASSPPADRPMPCHHISIVYSGGMPTIAPAAAPRTRSCASWRSPRGSGSDRVSAMLAYLGAHGAAFTRYNKWLDRSRFKDPSGSPGCRAGARPAGGYNHLARLPARHDQGFSHDPLH